MNTSELLIVIQSVLILLQLVTIKHLLSTKVKQKQILNDSLDFDHTKYQNLGVKNFLLHSLKMHPITWFFIRQFPSRYYPGIITGPFINQLISQNTFGRLYFSIPTTFAIQLIILVTMNYTNLKPDTQFNSVLRSQTGLCHAQNQSIFNWRIFISQIVYLTVSSVILIGVFSQFSTFTINNSTVTLQIMLLFLLSDLIVIRSIVLIAYGLLTYIIYSRNQDQYIKKNRFYFLNMTMMLTDDFIVLSKKRFGDVNIMFENNQCTLQNNCQQIIQSQPNIMVSLVSFEENSINKLMPKNIFFSRQEFQTEIDLKGNQQELNTAKQGNNIKKNIEMRTQYLRPMQSINNNTKSIFNNKIKICDIVNPPHHLEHTVSLQQNIVQSTQTNQIIQDTIPQCLLFTIQSQSNNFSEKSNLQSIQVIDQKIQITNREILGNINANIKNQNNKKRNVRNKRLHLNCNYSINNITTINKIHREALDFLTEDSIEVQKQNIPIEYAYNYKEKYHNSMNLDTKRPIQSLKRRLSPKYNGQYMDTIQFHTLESLQTIDQKRPKRRSYYKAGLNTTQKSPYLQFLPKMLKQQEIARHHSFEEPLKLNVIQRQRKLRELKRHKNMDKDNQNLLILKKTIASELETLYT